MKAARYALLAAAVFAVFGCSMRQHLSIGTDGSGSATVDVVLGALIAQYMNDVIGSLGGQSASGALPPLFDLPQIRNAFAEVKGVRLTALSTPARDALHLGFTFDDVTTLFPQLSAAAGKMSGGTSTGSSSSTGGARATSPLEFTHDAGITTLRLTLSRATWPAIAALPPFRDDPLLASLGPQSSRQYSEEDYLSLLEYAFADYASKEQVREALTSSFVTITVGVRGTIVSETGGTRSGDSVVYRVPLSRIATLAKPIELSVSFR